MGMPKHFQFNKSLLPLFISVAVNCSWNINHNAKKQQQNYYDCCAMEKARQNVVMRRLLRSTLSRIVSIWNASIKPRFASIKMDLLLCFEMFVYWSVIEKNLLRLRKINANNSLVWFIVVVVDCDLLLRELERNQSSEKCDFLLYQIYSCAIEHGRYIRIEQIIA